MQLGSQTSAATMHCFCSTASQCVCWLPHCATFNNATFCKLSSVEYPLAAASRLPPLTWGTFRRRPPRPSGGLPPSPPGAATSLCPTLASHLRTSLSRPRQPPPSRRPTAADPAHWGPRRSFREAPPSTSALRRQAPPSTAALPPCAAKHRLAPPSTA